MTKQPDRKSLDSKWLWNYDPAYLDFYMREK